MMTGQGGRNRRNLLVMLTGIAISLPGIVIAQTPTTAASQFEVASIRQVPSGRGYTSISPSGSTRFTARNVSMKLLIEMAFGVEDYQISGKDLDWLDSELYDVEAKPEGDVSLSYEQMKPLLQNLLAQRFKLMIHHEQKDFRGYALMVAKNGPRLHAGKEASTAGYILRNGIRSPGISMSGLATMLAHPLGRPVFDKTGITGKYDIKLSFAPDGSTDSPLPSIFTAVQEQLGLELEPQKVAVDMVVIDHLEKVPTEN